MIKNWRIFTGDRVVVFHQEDTNEIVTLAGALEDKADLVRTAPTSPDQIPPEPPGTWEFLKKIILLMASKGKRTYLAKRFYVHKYCC